MASLRKVAWEAFLLYPGTPVPAQHHPGTLVRDNFIPEQRSGVHAALNHNTVGKKQEAAKTRPKAAFREIIVLLNNGIFDNLLKKKRVKSFFTKN